MDKKRYDQYLEKMRDCTGQDVDVESAHIEADEIIADFVKELGYDELYLLYLEVRKWYQ